MDASSLLRKQGWRGDGHSLDHSDRGIKKPLLVSKKVDVLGLGLNKHASVSDQWWLRAFDNGLKNFGTGQESTLAQVQKHGVNRGGLYANFIPGEKLEGSLGNTPNDTDGADTPVEAEQAGNGTMGIDIPPADKLERTVGQHDNQNGHDAMMYLLQNPKDAPASMHKMLDRKRKRAERPVEKRARRKLDRAEKSKTEAKDARRRAKEDGTWDEAKEEEHRQTKMINRGASEFVVAAQQLGYIPAGPNEIRKGIVAVDADGNIVTRGQPTAEQQHVFGLAGFDAPVQLDSKKRSVKQDKFAREKMKRELKRAAKTYLKGEKPTSELTEEELRVKKEEKSIAKAAKRNEAAWKEAQRMAIREDQAARKMERRAEKKAERAEIDKILAERKAAEAAGGEAEQNGENAEIKRTDSTSSNGFENGADELRFGMNRKGGFKKVPGVGRVDRYPSKAEKKAKKVAALAIKNGITEEEVKAKREAEVKEKEAVEQEKIDRYRAMKHGMTIEQWRAGLAKGEVFQPWVERRGLAPEKLAEYKKRADEKGVSLEVYVQRRDEKTAAKLAEQMGNPFQKDIRDHGDSIGDVITAYADDGTNGQDNSAMADGADGPGFVIDTTGDGGHQPTARQKILAITAPGKSLAIIDTLGDDSYTYQPNMPVPLDPRVWEGKTVSELPKAVRLARREWLRIRRETRKQSRLEATAAERKMPVGPPKKNKGQRKIEAREAFVKQLLFNSRQALNKTGSAEGMMTIDGVEGVPMIKVQSTQGIYSKVEVGLARTVARRVLRNVKREEKAKNGKGKGYKKRERAAKDAATNAGISGFTDRARLEVGYQGGKRDDLLM